MSTTTASEQVDAAAILGAAAPAPEVPEWAVGLPDEDKAWVAKAGHKELPKVIGAYRNLERFMGADKAGRGVVIPANDADADGWQQVYAKLGRPEAPEAYELDKIEGVDSTLVKSMAPLLHNAGLNKQQAKVVAEGYVKEMQAQDEQRWAQLEVKEKAEVAVLQRSLGTQFEPAMESAVQAARAAGLVKEEADAIRTILGPKKFFEMMSTLGKSLMEDTGPGRQSGAPEFASPGAAQAEIARLMADREFTGKLFGGDGSAKERWEKLHRAAAG
jgi:hypothetical protein